MKSSASASALASALVLASALALTMAFPFLAMAEEGESHACQHACQPGKFEMVHATGMIYCVNCALKAEFGANVDCAKSGHRWAVKVSKAEDYCGEERAALVGTTIFCLENEAAKGLADIKTGTTTLISGRLYNGLQVMEVEEVTAIESKEKDDCCPEDGEEHEEGGKKG